MTMGSNSILLRATERSGTNLLRAIMSNHSQISSPPPFSMIDVMGASCHKYLGDDAIKLTQAHLNPWENEYSRDDVKLKVGNHSFWEVFRVLNELYAESEHKQYWSSKEPGLVKRIHELAMHLSERLICTFVS